MKKRKVNITDTGYSYSFIMEYEGRALQELAKALRAAARDRASRGHFLNYGFEEVKEDGQ